MPKTCVYRPKDPNKSKLFKQLKDSYGFKIGAKVFNKVTGEDFIDTYRDSLSLVEGVPTFDSLMANEVVKSFIGESQVIEAFNKKQPHLLNTLDNVALLVNKAQSFNTNPDHASYVAIVDYDSNQDLTIKIEAKTPESAEVAQSQYKIQKLNEKVAEILGPLGVTMSTLSEVEVAAGRVGLTNFNHAADVANGFAGLMQVANNLEGHTAISEEFAHIVIGMFRNKPLVQRTINFLKDEQEARKVLGTEYETVSDYYGGDVSMIAEEAAGHILRNALIKRETAQKPLFKRMIDYIVNLFKNINPGYYKDSIETVTKDMSSLADKVISRKVKLTQKDLIKAQRKASFNALSKKAQAQLDVLNKAVERSYKNAALQENLEKEVKEDTQKMRARTVAESINTALKDKTSKEETMAAISAYLGIANENLDDLYETLSNAETLDMKDRFTVLRNTLYTLQAYAPTVKELKTVTTESYLSDEGIQQQTFMIEDNENKLEDYEAQEDVEPVDTSHMSVQDIANQIVKDSKDWELSEDESDYINRTTGEKGMRVTQVIAADKHGEAFDPTSPWITPSTNIGTGIDELVRDFLAGRIIENNGVFTVAGKPLSETYPNATNKALNTFVNSLKAFQDAERAKGINLIARDVTVNGTIETIDGTGKAHKVNVVGTLDLLGYDNEGNWYIYDMKTYRGKLDADKKAKYERQLTLYKKLLEDKYGIKIKQLSIIPIKVTYPAPIGAFKGTAHYTVSATKPDSYNGRHSNQLEINGKPFKGANPALEELMSISERELNIKYRKLANDPTDGFGNGAQNTIDALSLMERKLDKISGLFSEEALPQFLEFLKPFVGENISIREIDRETGKPTGRMQTVSIAKVIKESPKDVTLAQLWLTSAADNPDALIQIFDKVVKQTKDTKRQKVIAKSQEILALGKEFEQRGITNYDWMYEEDKKNYINHLTYQGKDVSYDKSAYEKAKKKYTDTLDIKYGEHPEVGSEAYRAKKAAIKKWIVENTITIQEADGNIISIPNPKSYPSRWKSLTTTQKEFYNRWMEIKAELDALIGPDKTTLTNTIKIRKSNIERLKGVASDTVIQDFVEGVKAKVVRSFDDDISYAEAKGIRGFNGEEIMKLPLYYINAKTTKDLSTDAIGTLVAYAEMAYNYDAMSQVVNPLEIGRFLAESRKIADTRGSKRIFEDFNFAGKSVHNPLYVDPSKSNFRKLLDTFFESKVYNRYLTDNGEIAGIDKNKAAGILLKLGSTVQLGFNVLAGFANAATGLAMQNIEAAAGEFFNARELYQADKVFTKEMMSFMGDIGQRVKTSKLALFDEVFDVRQNYSSKAKHVNWLNKTILTRVFGPNIQYICQDAGDHWLYNRAAIAVALRHKLRDAQGKEISLWDALQVVPINPKNPSLGSKLVIKKGVTNLDGSQVSEKDLSDISGRMRYINQHCFGIYNEEDSIAARRTIVGRFLMQYRDWIPAQFRYRFGVMTSNLEKGGTTEGYYRTSGRILLKLYREVYRGTQTIPQVWRGLETFEKANIRRAVGELTQFMGLLLVLGLFKEDDKKRPWLIKMLRYILVRERTELGALTPIAMPKEMINIMKAPFANTSVISDLYNLNMLLWPPNYMDEIQSGEYKGHSSAYRAFMRSPLTLYYRTLKRSLDPEKAADFYDNR